MVVVSSSWQLSQNSNRSGRVVLVSSDPFMNELQPQSYTSRHIGWKPSRSHGEALRATTCVFVLVRHAAASFAQAGIKLSNVLLGPTYTLQESTAVQHPCAMYTINTSIGLFYHLFSHLLHHLLYHLLYNQLWINWRLCLYLVMYIYFCLCWMELL